MVNIEAIEKDEYARAFELMRTNMIVYHSKRNIPWDQSWTEAKISTTTKIPEKKMEEIATQITIRRS